MHPRNPHQGRYPLAQMLEASPQLRTHVMNNRQGEATIDFDNPAAVRALNQALLLYYYGIKSWEFPPHFLCPPIPEKPAKFKYMDESMFERLRSRR